MIKTYSDRHNIQKMCDKAITPYLLALTFVFHWFVTSKLFEKIDNAVFSNNDVIFGDTDSDIVMLFSNDIGLNIINLNNVNLDDNSFDNCKSLNY